MIPLLISLLICQDFAKIINNTNITEKNMTINITSINSTINCYYIKIQNTTQPIFNTSEQEVVIQNSVIIINNSIISQAQGILFQKVNVLRLRNVSIIVNNMTINGTINGLVSSGQIFDLSDVYYTIQINGNNLQQHHIISNQVNYVNILRTRAEVNFNTSLQIASLVSSAQIYQFNYFEITYKNISSTSNSTLSFQNSYASSTNQDSLFSIENILYKFANIGNFNTSVLNNSSIPSEQVTNFFCNPTNVSGCSILNISTPSQENNTFIYFNNIPYMQEINFAPEITILNDNTTTTLGYCYQQIYKGVNSQTSQICKQVNKTIVNINMSMFMCGSNNSLLYYNTSTGSQYCMQNISAIQEIVGKCYQSEGSTASTAQYFCINCVENYTLLNGQCIKNCDSSCVNLFRDLNSCQSVPLWETCTCSGYCDCGSFASLGASACNKSACANDTYIFKDGNCFRKCSNCYKGDAYLDPVLGKLVYVKCKRGMPQEDGSCLSPSNLNTILVALFGIILAITLVTIIVIGAIFLQRTRQINKRLKE